LFFLSWRYVDPEKDLFLLKGNFVYRQNTVYGLTHSVVEGSFEERN